MSEPRNVTPGHEDEEFRARYQQERREEPEWMAWKWANRGRGFPWLGVLLVLVGIALLLQYVMQGTGIGAGTLVLLAIGLAFLAGWLFGGSFFSMVPGVLLVALAVARLIEEVGLFFARGQDVPGLTSLALAGGFIVIWLIASSRGRRWGWPLWGAGIFGLVGVVQASGWIVGIPELGLLWPVLIIGLGLALLVVARRR